MQLPGAPQTTTTQVIQRAIPTNRQAKHSNSTKRRPATTNGHQGGDTTKSSSSTSFSGASSAQKRPSSTTSSTLADNKKLRHREVEKNRHRQLQAMVKTLSEKIPGRMDKETQVQTMKRAARYCIYLRDVLKIASSQHSSSSAAASSGVKDKLEKIYVKTCDNVERMISI